MPKIDGALYLVRKDDSRNYVSFSQIICAYCFMTVFTTLKGAIFFLRKLTGLLLTTEGNTLYLLLLLYLKIYRYTRRDNKGHLTDL